MDSEPVFDQLCSLCQDLFSKEPIYTVPHDVHRKPFHERPHHNIRNMQTAAQKGCHICSLLYGQIPREKIAELNEEFDSLRLDDLPECVVGMEKVEGYSSTGQESRSWNLWWHDDSMKIRVGLRVEPESAKNRISDSRSSSESPNLFARREACKINTHASLGLIMRWLRDCLMYHNNCRKQMLETRLGIQLPSRLIDTGPLDSEPAIRLIEGSILPTETPYIALSHCWGGHDSMRLTKRSAVDFARRVEFLDLPKTFREAVTLARELQIRFLWIDAMCIIQDCDEDWRIESSRMSEVYSYATLTVAATASTNSEGGLFFDGSPLTISPCQIPVSWKDLPCEKLIAYIGLVWRYEDRANLGGRLNTRAWTMQERLLSRRVLHCASDQLYWECLSLDAHEVQPKGIKGYPMGGYKVAHLSRLDDISLLNRRWLEIRLAYMGKDLTQETDRLPAISGLARRIHEIKHAEHGSYLAGLEKDNLTREIQWWIPHRDVRPRPVKYCAPTWSWMSSGGKKIFQNFVAEPIFDILEAKTFPTDDRDPYGQVCRGYLRVRGLLCHITVFEEEPYPFEIPDDEVGLRTCLVKINGHLYGPLGGDAGIYWDGDSRGHLLHDTDFGFYFLPSELYIYDGFDGFARGLVLRQSHKQKGEYQRVGFMNLDACSQGFSIEEMRDVGDGVTFDSADGQNLADNIRHASALTKLSDDAYLEFDGFDQYTIQIV